MGVFRSLRLRMAVSHALVLAVILLVLGAVGYLILARSLDRTATAAVTAAAAQQADLVRESDTLAAPPDNDVPSSSAIRTAVFLPDGGALGERDELPSWLQPQPRAIATVTSHGEGVRVATLPVRVDGRLVATVVSGRSLAPEEATLHRVRVLLGLAGAVAVVLGMLAGWFLAGRAIKPVRQAYEAQAAFAADASHEFRTPLAFIRSGVEVLSDADPELGAEVLGEVEHMTRLTEHLLLLARAEGGDLGLRVVPVECDAIAREAVARAKAGLGLDASVASVNATWAAGDRQTLRAALDAVLENVVRHGGGRAEVEVGALPSGWVRIAVVDHGPGLSGDLRLRAFERFFRSDPSRTGGGAGLGLALARALVEAQGGRVCLEESKGGGLTTAIELRSCVDTFDV
jgi:signal transduction histidine kinase